MMPVRRDDRGSMPMAMLVVTVVLSLSALLVPLVIRQIRSTQNLNDRIKGFKSKLNDKFKEIPGSPGSYNAVAHMRPWLQMEELTTSMRMVARIPQKA